MVRYLNPGGHNWAKPNLDGYGISFIVVTIIYTIVFLAGCSFVWLHRRLPAIRMRKIGLALAAILVLHVYEFMVFLVYPLNGAFPCAAEFWIMSIYLPIGIGLFQAQNQQLLIVSQEQNEMKHLSASYKPLNGNFGRSNGIGTPSYWFFRFKLWWNSTTTQGRCEAFVLAGMILQFVVSLILYMISRKFNEYGVIGEHTSPALCRRGWEWAPSILWQFLWNFFFGPYLLWKIRGIHDIYHWRLQTILSILAGLPGTPLWIAGVYTEAFAPINKYWAPAMWFVPGLVTMELVTLIFPIYQILKHYREVRQAKQIQQELTEFDAKRLQHKGASESMTTGSTGSKGRMFTMESLDHCLKTGAFDLQNYASTVEFNGENILFLNRVMHFLEEWRIVFSSSGIEATAARRLMFKSALNLYLGSVHEKISPYPINIESPIYKQLEFVFTEALDLLRGTKSRTLSLTSSQATPWDEPDETTVMKGAEIMEMKAMSSRASSDNESRQAIVTTREVKDLDDPLADYIVPAEFNSHIFDAAFKSIKFMVWSGTWQRFNLSAKRVSAQA